MLTEDQAVENLVKSESFVEFSKGYVPELVSLAGYHRVLQTRNQDQAFISALGAANNEESIVAEVYRSFSLDHSFVISSKNRMDNQLLTLFHSHPFLLKFDDAQVRNILRSSISKGFASDAPEWKIAKEEVNVSINRIRNSSVPGIVRSANAVGVNQAGLDVGEVMGCIGEALGVGAGGISTIAGLQELAKKGVQTIVSSVSEWLLKRAGWVGAAIMVFDFTRCAINEAND